MKSTTTASVSFWLVLAAGVAAATLYHRSLGFWLVMAGVAFLMMGYGLMVMMRPRITVPSRTWTRANVAFIGGAMMALADTAIIASF